MTLDLKIILQIKQIDIFCSFRSRNIRENVSVVWEGANYKLLQKVCKRQVKESS